MFECEVNELTFCLNNRNFENMVSIIMATYNSADFIEHSIMSVLNQTYTNWELLVTDDCSTDNTLNLLQEYASKDKRIKVFFLEKNSGPGVARNYSIKHAKGRFIGFCDSDDQWKPEKLEKQTSLMMEKDCALSYSSYDTINDVGDFIGTVKAIPFLNYKIMLRNNYIGCLTAMYDTQKVGKVYMPEMRKRQDWGLWLLILKKSDYAYGIEESLAVYRNRSHSISANKIKLIKYNFSIYRELENFSFIKSTYRLMIFFYFYFTYKKSSSA
jgi:teichuronic acid biosynthesis glycosyltransferase TuaG